MDTDRGYAYDEHDASPYDKKVLAAVFDTPESAKLTIRKLNDAGFNDTWMGTMRATGGNGYSDTTSGSKDVVVENSSFGASVARFFGEGADQSLYDTLVKRGVPATDAMALDHHIHDGGAVITVGVDTRYDEAASILRMDDIGLSASSKAAPLTGVADTADTTLTLSEERLQIDKQRVAAGEASVGKKVVSEAQSIDVPVTHEEFFISRRPVTGRASTGTIDAGETIRVPLMRDQVIVDKRTFVNEEVQIGKRAVTGTQRVDETVRREELIVNKGIDDTPL